MNRGLVAAAVAVTMLGAAACGRGAEQTLAAPMPVPAGVVPDSVHDDKLSFYENDSDDVRHAFGNTRDSLAADGRAWDLRKADRLIGFLQVTTVKPSVDLSQEKYRNQVLAALTGAVDRITIDETMVWFTRSNDRATYLWFGKDIYAILSIKANEQGIDIDKVITDLVRHVASSDNWRPLYIDEEEFI